MYGRPAWGIRTRGEGSERDSAATHVVVLDGAFRPASDIVKELIRALDREKVGVT